MWPTKDKNPSDLLGIGLKALDPVRLQFQVHIEDLPQEECLKISCPAYHQEPEHAIAKAMGGVRAAIKASLANEVAARPLYIVAPPEPEAMRSLVVAADLEEVLTPRPPPNPPRKSWKARDIGFAGNPLPENAMLEYKYSGYKALGASNLLKIEDRLRSGLMLLCSSKRSMRMRVHFGRTVLTKTLPRFRSRDMNFEEFLDMTDKSSLESEFDKE